MDPATTALLDDIERRTCAYFVDTAHPQTGLAPDRWPSASACSIAATGHALTAHVIAAERGFIDRADAAARVRRTLATLQAMPPGRHGFCFHFVELASGARAGRSEVSTIDTTLLLAGVLCCETAFDRDDAVEADIRRLAHAIHARIDWPAAQRRAPLVCHGWTPERGWLRHDWRGYDEALLLYILALGSPTHPLGGDAWDAWCATHDTRGGHLHFAPLFGHQAAHVWIDFRGLRDARGTDYFENSRQATRAQRDDAIANPQAHAGYGPSIWGLSACDGPGRLRRSAGGRRRSYAGYAERGSGGRDDGTLAPHAAGAAIAFEPELAAAALVEIRRRHGDHVYRRYGYVDAFNPGFTFADARLAHGSVVPGHGWFAGDHLGIDQGPLVAMIANHRHDTVWRVMRRNPHLRRGLQRAGFSGGWLG